MHENERKIKEQRTIEATRKGLVGGSSSKLGTIARFMGQAIIIQNDGYMSEYIGMTSTPAPLDPLGEEPKDGEYPTIEILDAFGYPIQSPTGQGWNEDYANRQQMSSYPIGWHFDGLNRGVHLEIKYLDEKSELTVHYKGILVFRELGGDLLTYNPSEWEDKVEDFYRIARKRFDASRKEERKEDIEKAKKNKESWIQKMRQNWGL